MLFRLLPVPLCVMKVFMHVNGLQSQNPQSTPCRAGILKVRTLVRIRTEPLLSLDSEQIILFICIICVICVICETSP